MNYDQFIKNINTNSTPESTPSEIGTAFLNSIKKSLNLLRGLGAPEKNLQLMERLSEATTNYLNACEKLIEYGGIDDMSSVFRHISTSQGMSYLITHRSINDETIRLANGFIELLARLTETQKQMISIFEVRAVKLNEIIMLEKSGEINRKFFTLKDKELTSILSRNLSTVLYLYKREAYLLKDAYDQAIHFCDVAATVADPEKAPSAEFLKEYKKRANALGLELSRRVDELMAKDKLAASQKTNC